MRRLLTVLALAGLFGALAASDARACHKKKCNQRNCNQPAPCVVECPPPPPPACQPKQKCCKHRSRVGCHMRGCNGGAAGPVVYQGAPVYQTAAPVYAAPQYASPQYASPQAAPQATGQVQASGQ